MENYKNKRLEIAVLGGLKMIKYKKLKTKNRANSASKDMDIKFKNEENKSQAFKKVAEYLLGKYGTITDPSNYNFHDKNLFVDFMVELQGYPEGFIYRVYGVRKEKVNWDKVHNIPNFWDNVDFKKLWEGRYN